jgi:hypothetical protein
MRGNRKKALTFIEAHLADPWFFYSLACDRGTVEATGILILELARKGSETTISDSADGRRIIIRFNEIQWAIWGEEK